MNNGRRIFSLRKKGDKDLGSFNQNSDDLNK